MNLSLSPLKLLVAGVLATGVAGAGLLVANQTGGSPEKIAGSGTQVLGEKTTQSGSVSGSGVTPNTKPTTPPGNGGGHGNGGNDNKTFTINGSLDSDLEPGGSSQLTFTVTNTTNQTISVDTLDAALDHVVLGAGRSNCTVANAGLTVDDWTGGSFQVAKGATAPAPGAVTVSMLPSSVTGCQGAQFWFRFTGTATK